MAPPKPPPPRISDVGEEFDLVEADDSVRPPPRPPTKKSEENKKPGKEKIRLDDLVLDVPKPRPAADHGDIGEEFDEFTEVERAMASLEGRDVDLAADLAVQRREAEGAASPDRGRVRGRG